MNYLLKENETIYIDDYHKDGVLFPFRVLTTQEAAGFRREFELIEQAFGGQLPYAGNMHLCLDWAYDLVMHPAILDYISPLLVSEIGILGSLMLTKYPKTNTYVSWHQDGINSKWDEKYSLTVWLALSNSNIQNGCMRVVAGSHVNAKQEHVYFTDDENMLRKSHKITSDIDETKAVNIELEAGESSVHHNNIIHGSGVNNSDTKRMGFAIRYTNPKYADAHSRVVYARGIKKYPCARSMERPDGFKNKNNPVAYKEFLEKNIVLK